MQRIYLIDVSSLFFRAFYAVRPLTSPKGVPVNAIYGFMSMLLKLMKDEKPDHLVFCNDRKEPSFRRDMYAEYKANRSEMPEDLVPQIPYIRKVAELLGIPSVDKLGFEADDVIGTLTRLGLKHGLEVFIVSGDKDFAQLIEPNVWLFDTMKNVKIGPKEAKEKWGVEPEQMIDYLALVGDSSDNVPGVRGIGPKGACKLLEEFKTLDGIYENLDKIKGSTHEKLVASREMAYLSKKLVTIEQSVPVSENIEDYHLKNPDQAAVHEFLTELNFKGFEKTIMDLPHWNGIEAAKEKKATEAAAKSAKAAAASEKEVAEKSDSSTAEAKAIKTSSKKSSARSKKETTDESTEKKVGPRSGALAGKGAPAQTAFSIEVDDDRSAFKVSEVSLSHLSDKFGPEPLLWGFAHEQGFFFGRDGESELFTVKENPSVIGEAIEALKPQWKGFHLKDLWHQLALHKRPDAHWDSLLASYVLRTGESMDWEQVYARAKGEAPLEVPTPSQKWTELIAVEKALRDALTESDDRILHDLDLPVLPVLYAMERRGILIDRDLLKEQSNELAGEIKDLEKQIHEQAQSEFNIASPKQLATILFEKLELPSGKKTKTGYSTDNEVLEKLRDKHPIAGLVLQYRELTKLKSTYVDALPVLIQEDGRVHTTFNPAHTATGRLSSLDPNLQNIPIRTARGTRVRKAFRATTGNALMSIDYSQIELRILAHYSNDANLIQAFQRDLDIHAATAAEIFELKLEDVKSDHRRTAKAVNFGIAYGQGAFGLAEVLGISRSAAQDIIKRYFERFPGVKSYIEDTIKSATEKGYVETLEGRRRYMDQLQSASPAIRKFGERAAINAPIQGTAADLVKKAMIQVDKQAKSDLLLQVHDELVFEGDETTLREEGPALVRTMESVAKLKVPLKANWDIGPNWDAAHG